MHFLANEVLRSAQWCLPLGLIWLSQHKTPSVNWDFLLASSCFYNRLQVSFSSCVIAPSSRCMSWIHWDFSNSIGHLVWVAEPKILVSTTLLVYTFLDMFYERSYSSKIKKKKPRTWTITLYRNNTDGGSSEGSSDLQKINGINHETIFSCKGQSRTE